MLAVCVSHHPTIKAAILLASLGSAQGLRLPLPFHPHVGHAREELLPVDTGRDLGSGRGCRGKCRSKSMLHHGRLLLLVRTRMCFIKSFTSLMFENICFYFPVSHGATLRVNVVYKCKLGTMARQWLSPCPSGSIITRRILCTGETLVIQPSPAAGTGPWSSCSQAPVASLLKLRLADPLSPAWGRCASG